MSDTTNHSPHDRELDRIVGEIRDEQLDPQLVREATDRAWTKIAAELGGGPIDRPLHSCEDFQTLIPAYLAGSLPEARAMLVGDHTRECVPCRRVLIAARRGEHASIPGQRPVPSRRRVPVVIRWAVAAAMLIGALLIGYRTTSDLLADQRLFGDVQVVDGSLQLVSEDGVRNLAPGDRVSSREHIRTAKGSGAMIRLTDGSMVEMAERSEIALRGRRNGTHVNLERGNVIVHAAKQHGGNLFVDTAECRVAVKGTIFSVNHGVKGSRVSVIEGEVEVRHKSERTLLYPGDQVTTDDKLDQVPVEQEIAWSRNHEEHLALLRELTAVHTEMLEAADVAADRTSTRLLDLCPADTVVYVAIPNLAEGMSAAYQVLEQHLEQSATLRSWWQDKVAASGVDQELDGLLDRLQPFADALGDELVVALPASAIEDQGGPVVLGLLDDPATFLALLQQELDRHPEVSGPALHIVDDPWQASAGDDAWLLWITNDLFVVTQTPAQLQEVAGALDGGSGFAATTLYADLAHAYEQGISWLLGLDIRTVLETAVHTDSSELAMLEQMGLLDASTLVLERHREGDDSAMRAVLDFDGPRRGMAAWLAPPAPMGCLDFISPNASLVSASVTKDASDMFNDVLQLMGGSAPETISELQAFEQEHGINLAEIATSLGGEAAFALDGPILPIPGWKLIVEVYNPEQLQHAFETVVAEANRLLAAEGQPGLVIETSEAGGLSYTTVRHLGTGLQVVWVVTDGYLVMAPQRALLELAIQNRAAGNTLTGSAAFRALLPADGYTDCSAMVYRDLARIAEMLPQQMLGQLPDATGEIIAEAGKPSLFCIYGEPERITLTGSGGSLLASASLLGLHSMFDVMGCAGS